MGRMAALLVVMLGLALCAPRALADGKAFRWTEQGSTQPILEREQRAAILHRDGVQRMVIAVNLELEDDAAAVWVFPVPGQPDNVTADVIDAFPEFHGRDPRRAARNKIGEAARLVMWWPYLSPLLAARSTRAGPGPVPSQGVTVHAEVTRWGVTVQVATAESVDALAAHVSGNEGRADPEQMAAFEAYLSDGYVLVIVRIASAAQVREEFPIYETRAGLYGGRWPCVYVEFPSERPFYPLVPTSTYRGRGCAHTPLRHRPREGGCARSRR